MGERRKLQGEIDRVLKKVAEGVDAFEDIWQKVQSAPNQNQKEKHELELKKEIKKLQRLRDQIKTWQASSEIKDKKPLAEARRTIENLMERFKVVERETKTKAYSKEGLGSLQKLDPHEKEKEDAIQWITQALESLNLQIDANEAEVETLSAHLKKKKNDKEKQERFENLKSWIARHKVHVTNLERLMRMVDNNAVNMKQVSELREDVEYYIESNQDPDFKENEYMYAEIDLDDMSNTICVPPTTAAIEDKDVSSKADVQNDNQKRRKSESEENSTRTKGNITPKSKHRSNTQSSANSNARLPAFSQNSGTSYSVLKSTATSSQINTTSTTSFQHTSHSRALSASKYIDVPLSTSSTQKSTQNVSMSLPADTRSFVRNADPHAEENSIRFPPVSSNATTDVKPEIPSTTSSIPVTEPSVTTTEHMVIRQPSTNAVASLDKYDTEFVASPHQYAALAAAESVMDATFTFPVRTPPYSIPKSLISRDLYAPVQPNNSTYSGHIKVSSDYIRKMKLLEAAFGKIPLPSDADRPKTYFQRSPVNVPSYYPHAPLPNSDTLEFYSKLSTESLFFIFYYAEGTKAQYMAAKTLKKRSWRFHTKYMMWFQRHEEPKMIKDDYEQGTYIYFDFDKWAQKKKEGFTFEYRYLEDKELL